MRNYYADKKDPNFFQPDLNEIVRLAIWIDPTIAEEDKRIICIRIVRHSGVRYTFWRKKNQITLSHITQEADKATLRYHFELYQAGEYFRLTWNPFDLTARLVGYDAQL